MDRALTGSATEGFDLAAMIKFHYATADVGKQLGSQYA
jgi:hypothetical protein